MSAQSFAGILLGTADAERLREWYVQAFNPRTEGPALFFGDVALFCDQREDVAEKNSEPGRHILNFNVENAVETAERLNGLGVTWLSELSENDHGWIGTLVDPDGNYVQIMQQK
ncbi:VOC family protein [Streptosporangium sp. NPDC000239]|uniref:VOC family protein n=1 Tax=Streptosporangium jomthongense TaxID=1193683 RepID=A0ABV8FDU3_9ACTN